MPSSQTRRRRRTQRQRPINRIQHHHFLLRMETAICPLESDKKMASDLLTYIVRDIDMTMLDSPRVYSITHPTYNAGLTAIAPIATSHIAFHFWRFPDRRILHHPDSNCLLQLDIYTCGSLTLEHIHKVMHHLTRFKPLHVNATLLNRNYSLTLERQLKWDAAEKDWETWVQTIPLQ
jgi:S-adenosylmethionine/arginine decarboxylase-like enzyme